MNDEMKHLGLSEADALDLAAAAAMAAAFAAVGENRETERRFTRLVALLTLFIARFQLEARE